MSIDLSGAACTALRPSADASKASGLRNFIVALAKKLDQTEAMTERIAAEGYGWISGVLKKLLLLRACANGFRQRSLKFVYVEIHVDGRPMPLVLPRLLRTGRWN